MRNKFLIVIVLVIILLVAIWYYSKIINIDDVNEITLKSLTFGFEKTRLENLILAAEKLNEELCKEGRDVRVKIETNFYDGGWYDYLEFFVSQFEANKSPDIYVIGHEYIPWLAKNNYIIQLNSLKEAKEYSDVFSTLWQAVSWKGNIWGALQDTELAIIIVNTTKLKELGWSINEIKSLPDRVIKGEFTLDDMSVVAKEAVDKGIVEWGVMHRPVNGQMFYMMAKNFQVQVFEEHKDEIIVDKKNLIESLEYFYNLTQKYKIAPEDSTLDEWQETNKKWEIVNQRVIDGKVLFYYGAIWSIFDYVEQGADYDELMNQFDFIIIPASKKYGKPITISHPLVYTISSQSEHKELAIRLLEIVGSAEYQVRHAVETYHLPINKSATKISEFKEHKLLNSLIYALDYTTIIPNDEKYMEYSKAYYKAVQNVESGRLTPDKAANEMEKELKQIFQNKCIFKY